MIGLYAIIHVPSHKAYIGSSVDIKRRLKEHRTDLSKKRHHCAYLQNAWNKYGSEQFMLRQIAVIEKATDVRTVEQAFLDCFFDDPLNTNPNAYGGAWGDFSPAKRDDWHMKTIMQRLTPDERKAIYGKTKGTKRDGKPYVAGAAKRLADPEYTKRLSEACKGKREIVECPHCGLKGGGGNMRRYHFDNCKDKK